MNHLIDKYNNLQGQKASRDYLIGFTTELFEFITENETALIIWERIHKVLDTYPDAKYFQFENIDQIKDHGLNGLLDGLEESQIIDDGYNTGLNKAVKPSDIYDMITNRMKELLKKASGSGYIKKWKARVYGEGYLIPFNFVSKKRYRGVNHFLLTDFEPLKNPFFLTFKQVDKLGGKVKKGANGHEVIYFTKLYKYEQAEPKLEFSTYDKKKMIKFLNDNKDKINLFKIGFTAESIANQSYLPILKYYNVFNGADIEGIDFDLENFKVGYINNPLPALEENKMPIAEAIIDNYPKPSPKYRFGGDKASYAPGGDVIKMPYIVDFESAQDYYRTYFHEIGHSTGAVKRLARDFSGKFGSKKYAFEELIAEWTAVFLSAEAGIVFHSNMNHAEYLKNWNNALTKAKDDNKFIMRACTEAQKAADFVLQFDDESNPKYLKDLEVKPEKNLPKPTIDLRKINTKKKSYKAINKFEKALKDNIPVSVKLEYESNLKKLKENHIKKYGSLEKKNNKPNLESNPKGFAIKPKSTTVETAIKDVLKLKKYKGEASQRQANIFYKYFSDEQKTMTDRFKEEVSRYVDISNISEITALSRKTNMHTFEVYDGDEQKEGWLELTELGHDFVNAVNRRLQSLVNQDNNLALFDGLKASVTPIATETVYLNLSSELKAVEPTNTNVATPKSAPEPTPETTSDNAQLHLENKPVEEIEMPSVEVSEVPSKYKTAAKAKQDNSKPRSLVNIADPELAKFLGKLERKPVQSLAVTLDSGEGGGKTHTFYRWANTMKNSGLKPIIWSLEQHATSSLAIGLAEKYFTNGNINHIAVESENDGETKEETYNRILESIKDFDVIFIDSWAKVLELYSLANFDQDFRKAFNGKIFFIIFQRTSDGKMRGGAKGGFDGDIILKVEVDREDFRNNYVYNHKNRYNNHVPLSELKYSPYYGKLITEETKPEPQPKKEVSGIVYS